MQNHDGLGHMTPGDIKELGETIASELKSSAPKVKVQEQNIRRGLAPHSALYRPNPAKCCLGCVFGGAEKHNCEETNETLPQKTSEG